MAGIDRYGKVAFSQVASKGLPTATILVFGYGFILCLAVTMRILMPFRTADYIFAVLD